MRTPDMKKITDILYNPNTDMYELYSFGSRIRRSPDMELLDRTAYAIESAYSKGRDDILQALNDGSATLEDLNETSRLMRTLINAQDPAFEQDALFGNHSRSFQDIGEVIRQSHDSTEF